eukprot:scaffold44632_cov85-Cyclotella_meneghiniana.AAC.4
MNNNNGVDHHQSHHTKQQKPHEAEQVLHTCKRSPSTSITVNENVNDKNLKGRTPEMGEDDFEIFRREFMTDIVTSLCDDLGDDIATLQMDLDTGLYNIEFDVTICQSKLPVNGAHPTNPKLPSNNTLMSQSTTPPTSLTIKSNIQHDKTQDSESRENTGGGGKKTIKEPTDHY